MKLGALGNNFDLPPSLLTAAGVNGVNGAGVDQPLVDPLVGAYTSSSYATQYITLHHGSIVDKDYISEVRDATVSSPL